MSEVPLYINKIEVLKVVKGYLAHKKTLTPLRLPNDHRQRPTAGSEGGAVSCE